MMHGDQHEFSLKRCEYSSAAIRIPFAECVIRHNNGFPLRNRAIAVRSTRQRCAGVSLQDW